VGEVQKGLRVALEGRRRGETKSKSCGRGLTRERNGEREGIVREGGGKGRGGKRRDRSCEVIVIKRYKF